MQGGSGLTRHVDAMLESLRDAKGQKPRLVHRLDRDTSGVLVVARTRLAAQKLAESFRTRSTQKIYWALVKGVPKPHQGRISTWLAKEEGPEGDRMRVARHGADEASHAVTLYSVVENAGGKLAWLTMKPVTGRTHQLRAHAAHIGHPIIGDEIFHRRGRLGFSRRDPEQAAPARAPHRHPASRGRAASTSPRRCRRTCSRAGTCSGSMPLAAMRRTRTRSRRPAAGRGLRVMRRLTIQHAAVKRTSAPCTYGVERGAHRLDDLRAGRARRPRGGRGRRDRAG